MTSPPSPSSLRALASAKPSSAPGEAARSEAAPNLLASLFPTLRLPTPCRQRGPAHAKPREPPTSNVSVKRPLSSSELRSPKLPRASQDTEWSNNPAQVTVALRGQSSSRASAPSSTAYDRFIQGYEPRLPSVKRQVGRPRRSPLPPNATQSPLSPRRDEAGDHAMGPPPLPLGTGVSAISPPSPVFRDPSGTSSATSPRSNAQDNMAMVAYRPAAPPASPYEPRFAGPYRETADKPPRFLYPKTADFAPRLSGSRIGDYSMSPSGIPSFDSHPPSSGVNINISSNASSPTDPHRTSPPSPAGPPPSPSHEGFSRQLPVPDALNVGSAALDGYKILRNAVPAALVRDLVFVMQKGLPITAHSDTHEAYSTPFHGYLLRDEFNANCRHALEDFYIPMQKKIPGMPKTSVVGSFLPGDKSDVRYSLLHVGHKDQIYVHIALNRLCARTGFYHILKGSHLSRHPTNTPVANWSSLDLVLEEGDAFIWRGDISYFLSSGGGGLWMCLTYDWGPGMVDLTKE